jgi:bifunctional N-acetylglucosamine-1-phosphate-uridyltransferase/glucosamine-1-phosphate-acetyltransferase GlmU-like protein
MAGGSGTRMNSPLPKQILDIYHKPMLIHIMDQLIYINNNSISSDKLNIILVLSEKNKEVILNNLVERKFFLKDNDKYFYKNTYINIIIQNTTDFKGTGGAIMACEEYFKYFESVEIINKECNSSYKNHVLILSADVPLITNNTINNMFKTLKSCKACILAKVDDNNFGYGRVHIKSNGLVEIIEHKDCNEEQLKINMINTGIYSFEMNTLRYSLTKLDKDNSQRELYLTDTIKHIDGVKIVEYDIDRYDETLGANTPDQLDMLKKSYLQKFSIEDIFSNESNLSDENILNLCKVLNQLSPTKNNNYNIQDIRNHINDTCNNKTNTMNIYVLKYENRIIGTGSIIVEKKILRNLSKVGHIEDVVIDEDFRGIGLSKYLIKRLIQFCEKSDCYKIILDCSNHLIDFYKKFGFEINANTMRLDIQ